MHFLKYGIVSKWWTKVSSYQNVLLLLSAFIVGIFYTVYLIRGAIVPTNDGWLINNPDLAENYLTLWLYRNDPSWHFPITFTDNILYPTGLNIVDTSVLPLLAVVFKPFAYILPHTFQYLGLVIAIHCSLQIYFGFRITQILSSNNLILSILGSLLLLLTPSLSWGLYSACHWLVLWSVFLYLKDYKSYNYKTVLIPHLILIFLTITLQISLLLIIISFTAATYTKLYLLRHCSNRMIIIWSTITILKVLFIGTVFGYIKYQANLHIPSLYPYEFDGHTYLGIAVIILVISNVIYLKKITPEVFSLGDTFNRLLYHDLLPLTVVSVLLGVFGLISGIIIFLLNLGNSHLFKHRLNDIDSFLSIGRLFWPIQYMAIIGILVLTYKYWPRTFKLYLIFILLIAIQFISLIPMQKEIATIINPPTRKSSLTATAWQKLYEHHTKLIILPAYQCDVNKTPTGNYTSFAYLAAQQKLKINSFNVSSMPQKVQEMHCQTIPELFIEGTLELDAAYVLSDELFDAAIKRHNFQNHHCERVDGLILCVNKKSLSRT